jgi:serine/threonine protein kinase
MVSKSNPVIARSGPTAAERAFVEQLISRSRLSVVEPVKLPAQCAERYELVRQIGRGGYGMVWLARDRELEREVALKVLYGRAASDPATVERFVHEAAVTARMRHPHIVRVWEHGIEEGIPWIAFEYLGDTSLQSMLKERGRLPVAMALDVVDQVAAALEEAHAHGVLHRDLKPDNVIAERPGVYKLIDFGVAGGQRSGRFRTDVNFIMGTPAYLAPEQIRCVPASELTDQYQLGLLAHHLLCGVLPHAEDHLPKMLGRRSAEPVESLRRLEASLPEAVDEAVRRMLSTDPAERFASVSDARAALKAAFDAPGSEPRRRQPTVNVRLDSQKVMRSTRLAPISRVIEFDERAAVMAAGPPVPTRVQGFIAFLTAFLAGALAVTLAHALGSQLVRLF